MSTLSNALAKLKGWPLGAGIGAALMAVWLWIEPERRRDLSPTFLFLIAAGLGVLVHSVLSRVSGWFCTPLFRHLEAAWEAKLENHRLSVVMRRGIMAEGETRRLGAAIEKRYVRGESGPYEPPRKRNRKPKPPAPPSASNGPGAGARLPKPAPPSPPRPGKESLLPPDSDA